MHVIAGASPDNTPAGYYWTFLFPMLLFIVSALILWGLFGRPHQRVPARPLMPGLRSRSAASTAASAQATASGESAPAGDALNGADQPSVGDSGSGAAGATA